MPVTLKWPLTIAPSGKLEVTTNDQEIWAQRLKALLSTRYGERAMRSTYGCELPERLFDSFPTSTPEEDIRRAVGRWLSLISIVSVEVTDRGHFNNYGVESLVKEVDVAYELPSGALQNSTLTFNNGESE